MNSRLRDPLVRNRAAFLLGFAAYFAVLWWFWNTQWVYPLKMFVVLLHELSHGLVAIVTGGYIDRIVLDPAQGGLCECPGGSAFLTLSAGYLGSLVWGGLLVIAGHELKRWSGQILLGIGVAVVALSIVFVRGSFGLTFGVLFGLALVAVARLLPPVVSRVALTTLGLTSCLYAILDIKSDVIDRPELRSDARMLAEMTGVPTLVWGVLWILLALAFSWLLLRRAYRKST